MRNNTKVLLQGWVGSVANHGPYVVLTIALLLTAHLFVTFLLNALTIDPNLMYAPTRWCEEHHPEWTLEQCADAAGY